ncbi:hypothetical protein GGF46_000089 [Coemansia sp. RSA 552]|nr:hypothetical protein GGF46_000089 [Coemansia sp. RSA 552]
MLQLLATYVLGVLTVPALVGVVLAVFLLTAPDSDLPADCERPEAGDAADAEEDAGTSPYSGRRAGWLRIRRTLGGPVDDGQVGLADVVARGLARWVQGKGDGAGQDLYYVVLDGDTLVMYDGEAMSECRGVIIMSKHSVTLHHAPDVSESQVYSRRTPIRLAPGGASPGLHGRQAAEYYVYADRPSDKEDWYFALLWSSLASRGPDEPAELRMRRACLEPDAAGLDGVLQAISRRGAGATGVREDEWLNAILGRVFVGAYRTEWVRQHFKRKMQTKFDRVERPAFLERVIVADLDVGDHVPVLTSPRLEAFERSGQVDVSMFMHYMGGFRLVLNTAVRIGALRLPISLSVVLQSLAGKMLLRFKPAPSNRFWLAFYEMPRIRLKLEPVFMQKQVKYTMVSQAIENQIYDMVRLTLVLPHLDDTIFFPAPLDDGAILERSLRDFVAETRPSAGGLSDEDEPQTPSSPPPLPVRPTSGRRDSASGIDRTNALLKRMSSHSTPEPPLADAEAGSSGSGSGQRQQNTRRTPQAMTTPTSLSGSTESSQESLGQRVDGGDRASDSSSLERQASVKSTFSMLGAASLLKRAQTSQAAESAKTWWQSIQQNGLGSDSASEAPASTRQTTEPDTPAPAEGSARPVPPVPGHISTPPRAVTSSREAKAGGAAVGSSVAVQLPRVADGGASSSVYRNRTTAAPGSLLVRRRQAPSDTSL